jgi:hypothetical protein
MNNNPIISVPKQLQNERFGFIELGRNSKIPVATEKGWAKNKPHTYQQIQAHINSGNNYGVRGGYGNLIIIDTDHEEMSGLVFDNFPETFTVKSGSGRGFHFYYFCEGIEKKIVLDKDKKHYGDVISHGTYVVGASSIHDKTKKPYLIQKDLEIATIDRETLLSTLIEYLPNSFFPKPDYKYESASSELSIMEVLWKFLK